MAYLCKSTKQIVFKTGHTMDTLSRLPFIYDIATSDKNWTTALDQFSEVAGSKGAVLFVESNVSDQYTISQVNSFIKSDIVTLSEYIQKYSHYDRYSVDYIKNTNAFRLVPECEVWPELSSGSGREDLDFLRAAFGVGRLAGINVSNNPAWVSIIALQFDASIQDPLPKSGFGTALLSSHMAKAIEINRFYSKLRTRYQAVLAALDHVDVAICILLPSGEVLVHNAKAQIVFQERNGISLTRENHLRLRDEDQTAKLCVFAQQCCQTAAGKSSQPERFVKAGKNTLEEGYLIEISPLRDGDNELNEDLSGAMMTIIDPADPPKLSVKAAARLYNLTEAETAVSQHLVEGRTVPEIADIRGVSIDTVRNQARSIHSKLSVGNRAELIRKVTTVSPPVTV